MFPSLSERYFPSCPVLWKLWSVDVMQEAAKLSCNSEGKRVRTVSELENGKSLVLDEPQN